jgi:hypothetical protein
VNYSDLIKDENGMLVSSKKKSDKKDKKKKSKLGGEEVGYLPLRKDFDVTYDHCAEEYLAYMEINEDDTEEEKNLKLEMLKGYYFKLEERIKKINFVLERGN